MECNFNVLAENEHGYVGQCTHCFEFNFVYKNILITFSEECLLEFFHWLLDHRDHPSFYFPLLHGRTHVYQSPLENMFIVFNDEEMDEVTEMVSEVMLILEARKLVSRPT